MKFSKIPFWRDKTSPGGNKQVNASYRGKDVDMGRWGGGQTLKAVRKQITKNSENTNR